MPWINGVEYSDDGRLVVRPSGSARRPLEEIQQSPVDMGGFRSIGPGPGVVSPVPAGVPDGSPQGSGFTSVGPGPAMPDMGASQGAPMRLPEPQAPAPGQPVTPAPGGFRSVGPSEPDLTQPATFGDRPPPGMRPIQEKRQAQNILEMFGEPEKIPFSERFTPDRYNTAQIWRELDAEAREQVSKGYRQFTGDESEGEDPSKLWGALNMLGGGINYTLSPLNAAVRRTIGNPLEDWLTIPRSYSEFATTTALPVVGLGKIPKGTVPEKIFGPEHVSAEAGKAAGLIRQRQGLAARDTLSTLERAEPYRRVMNSLSPAQRYQFIDDLERGRKGADPRLNAMADELRFSLDDRMSKIASIDRLQQTQFVQDYFPHMWQDPQKAREFIAAWGKEGSGANLRKRTIPTIQDGLRAGLKPISNDPLELYGRYITNMDKFIATEEVFEQAVKNGDVQFASVAKGANSRPPDGWVPVHGRFGDRAKQLVAYADPDWARVYNNFVSKGFAGIGDAYGTAYENAQKVANAVTQVELGLSGYHAFTMAQEAILNSVAKGMQQFSRGEIRKGVGSMAEAITKPVKNAMVGRQVEQIYLGKSQGSQEMREIVDLLTNVGGRGSGVSHARDYQFSAMGNFWKAWQRGALKEQWQHKHMAGYAKGEGLKETFALTGRALETVAYPIFQLYIPKLKNAAFYDNMSDWMRANPGATRPEKLDAARKIWDSVDNRFGEMVHDNIFWNNMLKQSAMLSLRSYSWTYGFLREAGGGVRDIGKIKQMGELPQRTAYVIALPVTWAAINGAYHYMKTGEHPDMEDIVSGPRTGGTMPGAGSSAEEVPERIMAPGFMKDMFGWLRHPTREAINKTSTAPRMLLQSMFNENWRGDIIRNEDDSTSEQVAQYLEWVTESLGPITVRQLIKGRPQGSNMNFIEDLLGVRQQSSFLADREGYADMMKKVHEAKARRKKRYEERQREKYGGPLE